MIYRGMRKKEWEEWIKSNTIPADVSFTTDFDTAVNWTMFYDFVRPPYGPTDGYIVLQISSIPKSAKLSSGPDVDEKRFKSNISLDKLKYKIFPFNKKEKFAWLDKTSKVSSSTSASHPSYPVKGDHMPAINFPIVQVLDEVSEYLDQNNLPGLATEVDMLNPANSPVIDPISPAREPPIGGEFAVPVDQMIKMLNEHLQLEYSAWHLYKLSAQLSLGPFASVVAEEFDTHAEEEEEHIDLISRKIVTLGGIPASFQQPADWNPPQDFTQAIDMNYKAELDAIISLNNLIEACGTNQAMAKELQDMVAKEAEHAEDLKMMRMYDSTDLKMTSPVHPGDTAPSYDVPVIPFPSVTARKEYAGKSAAELSKALRTALTEKDFVSAEVIEDELESVRASKSVTALQSEDGSIVVEMDPLDMVDRQK